MVFLNTILIVALVVIPTFFGYKKLPKEMAIAAIAISLALAFANIEKFSKFKGAGFEAEMRVEEVVNKAYAAIEEVKELGLILTTPIVDELALSGQFMQYLSLEYRLERVKKIETVLRKLGATENEIETA